MEFSYPCLRVQQDAEAKPLLLFSAPAIEIDQWIGIPQRLELHGSETAGFQRTVSPTREAALKQFFKDARNVIQNPILAAIRQELDAQVVFTPSEESAAYGLVTITFEDLSHHTMGDLLGAARAYLETRDADLVGRAVPIELIARLQRELPPNLAAARSAHGESVTNNDAADDSDDDSDLTDSNDGEAEDAIFDESQITDFWDHLRAREEIAKKLPPQLIHDKLLGFNRLTLESYLRPITLVDGQHRLRGAVIVSQEAIDGSDEAYAMVAEGKSKETIRNALNSAYGRSLPLSLLLDDSPAEHVFQYVVVNQRATPVPKALLGTIISTSLAEEELDGIAGRLENAKIDLQTSRVISILTKAEDSPFHGLVARGMDNEGEKLPWNVLGSLSSMFRTLKGAKYYHDPSTDHAQIWASHNLGASGIVADHAARGYESAEDYWEALNGPWLDVFKAFWVRVKERLVDEVPTPHNRWSSPRQSNIFNKPTLHILATDFFAFLRETRREIDGTEQMPGLVDDWLEYVSDDYFAKNWETAGVKKDSVGTRRQWSKLWAKHRAGGKAPAVAEFSKLLKA